MTDRDWRLGGQERFLQGVTLFRRPYQRYEHNQTWDHDHCAFCWATFAVADVPDALHEGYATEDDYHWVCPTCFEDFREAFGWRLGEAGA